jgi:hypothetical protein
MAQHAHATWHSMRMLHGTACGYRAAKHKQRAPSNRTTSRGLLPFRHQPPRPPRACAARPAHIAAPTTPHARAPTRPPHRRPTHGTQPGPYSARQAGLGRADLGCLNLGSGPEPGFERGQGPVVPLVLQPQPRRRRGHRVRRRPPVRVIGGV